MIDLASLANETAVEPPCGPDLVRHLDFQAFEELARGKPERQRNGEVEPAVDPNWLEVIDAGRALMLRSKDLRVAVVLVRAAVRTEGLPGLSPGLGLITELVTRYWEPLHPQLDPTDGNDPIIRISALAALANAQLLIRDLRDAPLVSSRKHARLLVRDVAIGLGQLAAPAGVTAMTEGEVHLALAEIAADEPTALPVVVATYEAALGLESALAEKLGPASALDLKPLTALLFALANAAKKHIVVAAEEADPDRTDRSDDIANGPTTSGTIRSRDDAVILIDKVIAYLEKNEPTNPAPLLFRRGKRFMTMNFLEIFSEVSPESIAKIEAIVGPAPQ